MARFADKVIVVTGGSAGIGLASARAFIEEGARRVYVTGRRRSALESACAELGERAVGVLSDVANLADLERLRAEVEARDAAIDVIVANAGISIRNELGRTSSEDFDLMFGVNVKGMFFTVQTLLPLMVDGGSIVLLSSYSSSRARPHLSLYNATKAAARSFARSFAVDLKHRRIRANAVSPGVTRTDIVSARPGLSPAEMAAMTEQIEAFCREAAPAGRSADAREVAEPILFLASSGASYINGAELSVDGGMGQV